MENHSKMFEMLENHFDSIERYKKYKDTDVRTKALMFLLDLEEVNADFHKFNTIPLLDEELPIVQGWIYKVLGNHDIPRETREEIAIASIDFASMVESINNSHTSTIK